MNDRIYEKEYLTIKEFAEFVEMTISTLRFYDRIGIFSPAKHGMEFKNNYRYYAPMQITTVKMLRVLTDIGIPLKTIKELTDNRTPEKLYRVLHNHRDRVAERLSFLNDAYSIIGTFINLLNEAICVIDTELTVSDMPEMNILLGDVTDFTGSTGFVREFTRFCNAIHNPKLNLSFPIGGYFESMEVFLKEPSQPTRFFSLDPNGHQKREAGQYLIGYTRGYYGQTNDLPDRMAAFAKMNRLVFSGPVYNQYLSDEVSVTDPDQYLLQAAAAVEETRRAPTRHPRYRV